METLNNTDNQGIKSLSKERRKTLETYQQLFYLLQVSVGHSSGWVLDNKQRFPFVALPPCLSQQLSCVLYVSRIITTFNRTGL